MHVGGQRGQISTTRLSGESKVQRAKHHLMQVLEGSKLLCCFRGTVCRVCEHTAHWGCGRPQRVEALGLRPQQHQAVTWQACGHSPGRRQPVREGGTAGPRSLQGPGPASHPPCPLPSPLGSHKFSETGGHAAAALARHRADLRIHRDHADSPFIWAAPQLSGFSGDLGSKHGQGVSRRPHSGSTARPRPPCGGQ